VQRLLGLLEPNEAVGGVIIGRGVRLRNKNLARLKEGKLENISYVHLHHSHVSKSLIDLAHSQGIKVFVWTCNSLFSIRNAVNCGADGIISDDLKLLKHELEKG
jgi:glycerophosphoryl diester phosphodiesterase